MNKKSIFSQLFSFTVIIIIISFIVMGTLVFGFLGSYFTQRQERDLTYIANNLADFTVRLSIRNPNYSKENYQMNVDALSLSSECFITVLNTNGDIIANTSTESASVTIREENYKPVMQGQRVRFMGTLGNVFKTPALTVGVPIISQNKAVFGGVFVSMPVPEVQELRNDVLRIFLYSAGLILLVALVVIYIMSLRITLPLKKLNRAVKEISDGHLSQRVSLSAANEIGELGDSFNKMADSIEQLETMRRSFVANVSHDLRTPMTTISGFLEGILDGTIPPEKQNQYLSIVLDETKRLSRLVTDLLDLSKLEDGNYTPEMREFDINEMIRLSIIKLEKRITEKNIQLTVNFETDSLRVLADKDSIQRVLTNLFDNAIKFTNPDGFIDIKTGFDPGGKAFVCIQNSGEGIKEGDLPHIFDRFYKTDTSRSKDKNGTGLGLYIAKNILKSHNEQIWAESVPNEYTRFSFTLAPVQSKKH